MTDNTKMADLPWHDGTTRTVPEWTPYVGRDGNLAYAREGGYSFRPDKPPFYHDDDSAAVRILTEAPEPPVKVNVPTGIGAVVSLSISPDSPGYVLTRNGWHGLLLYTEFDPSEIGWRLRNGARVLYEGVEE